MKIKNTELNRLNKEELANLMRKVSIDVACAVAPTYGPYGANTLIQTANKVQATKDGWNVVQYLNYPNNGVLNALKGLIIDCAQPVLLKYGDGTSTVMLLAYRMYEFIYSYILKGKKSYNIREIESTLSDIVDELCQAIISESEKIDMDKDGVDVIRDIARISTNWDEEMSNFIAKIYEYTHNPIIKFENSGSDKSYVEFIDGYEIKGELQLPQHYITDHVHGECVSENPVVIIFDHAVGQDNFELLNMFSGMIFTREHRELVVIAPDFQPTFINTLNALNIERHRKGMKQLSCIPFKYYTHVKEDKECINDLCCLFGTTPISENNTDMSEMFQDVKSALSDKAAVRNMTNITEEQVDSIYKKCSDTLNVACQYLLEVGGSCGKITLTKKHMIAQDFNNADMQNLEQRRETLKHEIDVTMKECAALSMITEGIRMKRIRQGKLELKMGVIHVGGFGDANLKGKRDALDDATKACEAAYYSGYTYGGGVAGLIALDKCDSEKTELRSKLIKFIEYSYREVIHILHENKYGKQKEQETFYNLVEQIIDRCILNKVAYNIITDQYDSSLISPVSGEIEILKGAMTLVMAMINANQMVFQDITSIEDVERLEAIEECGDISTHVGAQLLGKK